MTTMLASHLHSAGPTPPPGDDLSSKDTSNFFFKPSRPFVECGFVAPFVLFLRQFLLCTSFLLRNITKPASTGFLYALAKIGNRLDIVFMTIKTFVVSADPYHCMCQPSNINHRSAVNQIAYFSK